MVWLPSSSSHLYKGDRELVGLKGGHGYFAVADASDIPRAGQVLFDRLWLAGLGQVKLDQCGRPLLRTPYDRAMMTAVQPAFAAGMHAEYPFRQDRGAPQYVYGIDPDGPIDTRSVFLDLTQDEIVEVRRLQDDAVRAVEPEANEKREAWLKDAEKRIMADPNITDKDATIVSVRKSVQPGAKEPLSLGHPIRFRDGQTFTVAHILKHAKSFDGARCYHPYRSDYFSGYIHVDNNPCIWVCNGGGHRYPLSTPEERMQGPNLARLRKAMGLK